jgi:hypothetical protein
LEKLEHESCLTCKNATTLILEKVHLNYIFKSAFKPISTSVGKLNLPFAESLTS